MDMSLTTTVEDDKKAESFDEFRIGQKNGGERMITLNMYLTLATLLFAIGLFGVIRRKNLLMLFATEIMLNAANIALAAISYYTKDLSGQVFAFSLSP